MSTLQITKSEYAAGVQCSKRLYFLVHDSELATAPGDDLQLRFKQGREVGELARARFPEGSLVTQTGSAIEKAIEITSTHLSALQVSAIFEAAVRFKNFLIRADILKNNFDGTWDLIEVKSTTELKAEHLDDVAFQLFVLRGAGIKINKVYLSHINNKVTFPNLNDFFIDHDFTDSAIEKLPEVELKLRSLVQIIDRPLPPEQAIGRQCANPYGCEFKSECWKDVPKGSVLELYNYRKRNPTKFDLYHRGPKLIQELGEDVELTRFQQVQFLASKTDEAIIDHAGLSEFLAKVQHPIYYFDFETIAPPVPILNGMRPYQRIPVQFSCHVQNGPGADLKHHEFLASGTPGSDPRRECIDAMRNVFTTPGTIVAYHDDFERSLIRELAQQFVEFSDFLLELEKDFWDLEDAFQNHFYHQKFGGSCSIKKVLPFFAPEMKYEYLEIKNGGQAQAALVRLLTPGLLPEAKDKLRKDLLTYCAQDSMAMVVIHQKLIELTANNIRFLRQG
ncbi:MAG: hypothetical protein JWQ35_885 [Bacteriovoracaceae bacterium]|nr:hypothetical protein [Bacteriovoracaceae bacterium]